MLSGHSEELIIWPQGQFYWLSSTMGVWLNGSAPLAVVAARFLLSNKSLLFSFTGLDLCLSMHRRTRKSTKVAGHVLGPLCSSNMR